MRNIEKLILAILMILCVIFSAKSQDCVGYWNYCHNDSINNLHDSYQLVTDAKGQVVSKSAYILDVETIETFFDLRIGYDYRMSIANSSNKKTIVQLFSIPENILIYDNTTNDSIQLFEFEQRENFKVKAIISIPKTVKKQTPNVFQEKSKRYCIGFKLESMITRK